MEKAIKKYFIIFELPTLIASFLGSFILGIYLSLTEFTTATDSRWIGLANYKKAFIGNSDFFNALWFTLKFTIVSVISINLISFSLALLLTRGLKGTNLFRTVFFMPNLVGGIVLGYIWQIIINGILLNFVVYITFSAKYGFWGLVILMNWQLAGYMMIIYIAGIQNISSYLKEAAKIDGCNPIQTFFLVVFPILKPTAVIFYLSAQKYIIKSVMSGEIKG